MLCIFLPHRWLHIGNVLGPNLRDGEYGLWQCARCKELSRGRTTSGAEIFIPPKAPGFWARVWER